MHIGDVCLLLCAEWRWSLLFLDEGGTGWVATYHHCTHCRLSVELLSCCVFILCTHYLLSIFLTNFLVIIRIVDYRAERHDSDHPEEYQYA